MAVCIVCCTGVKSVEDLSSWVSGFGCQLIVYRVMEL